MRMRTGARLTLIGLAIVVGLAAFVIYSNEQEYGGNSAIEGLAKGYLPSSLVEVRDVDWGLESEAPNDYEVTVHIEDAEVRLIDGEGRVLFAGTTLETEVWLDEQGTQQFIGTNPEVNTYLDDLRDEAKTYTTSMVLGVIAVGMLVVAFIPNRRHQPRSSTQTAATT